MASGFGVGLELKADTIQSRCPAWTPHRAVKLRLYHLRGLLETLRAKSITGASTATDDHEGREPILPSRPAVQRAGIILGRQIVSSIFSKAA